MSKKIEFDEMQLLELTLEDSTNAEITSAIFAMLSKQQQNLIVEGLEQNRGIAAATEIQPVREIRMKIYEKRLQRLKMIQEHEDELA